VSANSAVGDEYNRGMRQCLANLGLAISVGGCSLIYNADNLPKAGADAASEALPIDANPQGLTVASVFPASIDEGAGDGGSRPAVLVITGTNFIDDATVTLQPTMTAKLAVVGVVVGADHDTLAVMVNAMVDPTLADGTSIPIALTVSQLGGTVSQSLPATALALTGLDEYPGTAPRKLYSQIEVGAGLSFTAGNTTKALLRSVSSIHVVGAIHADGSGVAAGPGGCEGGAKDTDGASSNFDTDDCKGHGFTVAGGLLNGDGGGGAGFVLAGNAGLPAGSGGAGGMGGLGDAAIASYANNVPSGGGGGASSAVTAGGPGGGGGGILELTAGGNVTLDSAAGVSAIGAIGANGAAGGGGGGAGGVIVLRAGGTLSVAGPLAVTGGNGGAGSSSTKDGGSASAGRTRVDAAHGSVPASAGYIGPMFVDAPTTSTTAMVQLNLSGSPNTSDATGRVYDSSGHVFGTTFTPNFGSDGTASVTAMLTPGYNKVCITVVNGNPTNPESTNCVEIAYLP